MSENRDVGFYWIKRRAPLIIPIMHVVDGFGTMTVPDPSREPFRNHHLDFDGVAYWSGLEWKFPGEEFFEEADGMISEIDERRIVRAP